MTSTPRHSNEEQTLKQWLEFQFMEIHKKLNVISDKQERLQQALLKKKSRKVNKFNIATIFYAHV